MNLKRTSGRKKYNRKYVAFKKEAKHQLEGNTMTSESIFNLFR